MSNIYLVTGAAGFIASHAVERLLARGEQVVGIDNFEPYYDRKIKEDNLNQYRQHSGFSFHEADIREADAMQQLFQQYAFTHILHAAAMAGVRPSLERPGYYATTNINGTINLLEPARQHGVENFVFISSSSVYGDTSPVPFQEHEPTNHPVSPYGATKKMGEVMCYAYHHLYQLPVSCMRAFTVYGPRQRPEMAIHQFVRRLHLGQPIAMFGDGSSQRDYTFVEDLVSGLVGALDHPHAYEIFNLGESQTITLKELIELIASVCGIEPIIDQNPNQPGDVRRTYADISKARQMIGYQPHTDMKTGITRFVEWYRQHRLEEDRQHHEHSS